MLLCPCKTIHTAINNRLSVALYSNDFVYYISGAIIHNAAKDSLQHNAQNLNGATNNSLVHRKSLKPAVFLSCLRTTMCSLLCFTYN